MSSSGLFVYNGNGEVIFNSNNNTLLYTDSFNHTPTTTSWSTYYSNYNKTIVVPLVYVDPNTVTTEVSIFGYFSLDIDISIANQVNMKKQSKASNSSAYYYESYGYAAVGEVFTL